MCGIVGFISKGGTELETKLISRLAHLEYRGYDSAGIVTHTKGKLRVIKTTGNLDKLRCKIGEYSSSSNIGLAHTRWATHGAPNEKNALPISSASKSIAIVFNGIVENDYELRQKMSREGTRFLTDNDSETLLLLIDSLYNGDLTAAVLNATQQIKGRFAFAVIHRDHPELIVAAKRFSPLVIGKGKDGYCIASDVLAIQNDLEVAHFLANNSVAEITNHSLKILVDGKESIDVIWIKPQPSLNATKSEKFSDFTLQEIFYQPKAIDLGIASASVTKDSIKELAHSVDRVVLVACGTAHFASMIGNALIERFAKIPAEAYIASEYQITPPITNSKTLTVCISQSGETADTLSCLEIAKKHGGKTLAICNVPSSSIAQLADFTLAIACGIEIGVASTKAYTGMLLQLAFLGVGLGIGNGNLPKKTWDEFRDSASNVNYSIEEILKNHDQITGLARSLRERRNFAFIGRDIFYPTACEGALKLRELSYRNAEGFAGGELKHGPLALIEPGYPVFAIAPRIPSTSKMIGNIQEAKARGARIIGVITEGDLELEKLCDESIKIPVAPYELLPILAVIPLQLFAYEMAKTLGRNIDRPRNLAKSVTVE